MIVLAVLAKIFYSQSLFYAIKFYDDLWRRYYELYFMDKN